MKALVMSFIYYNLLILFILESGDKLEKKVFCPFFFARTVFLTWRK